MIGVQCFTQRGEYIETYVSALVTLESKGSTELNEPLPCYDPNGIIMS